MGLILGLRVQVLGFVGFLCTVLEPTRARHVSSASRIREEVDILALRLQNYVPGLTLSEFKAPRLLWGKVELEVESSGNQEVRISLVTVESLP